jgi:hypothetical protein
LKHLLIILAFILTLTNLNHSQSIEETLSHLSSDAGSAYVEPIISAFGSNMNSGWVNGVPPATLLGLHFQVRLIVIGTFLQDANRTFFASGKFRYTSSQADDILLASGFDPSNTPNYDNLKNEILSQEWQVNIAGPTITGSSDEDVKVEFPGAEIQGETVGSYVTTLRGASGFLDNLSIFPQPAIQLDIGNVIGTSASIRYFPTVDIKDVGKASLWGVGLLHNIGFWFNNPLPIELGVGFFYQKLNVGDVFVNKSTQLGVYLSKTLGVVISFTPYLGVTYESSSTSVSYTFNFDTPIGPQNTNIAFDREGINNVALTIGGSLNLPVVSFNVDYKIAKIKTLTLGLSFGM